MLRLIPFAIICAIALLTPACSQSNDDIDTPSPVATIAPIFTLAETPFCTAPATSGSTFAGTPTSTIPSGRGTPLPTAEFAPSTPPSGLALDLEIGSQGTDEDAVPLKLIVSNHGPASLPLLIGGTEVNGFAGSYDFIATNEEHARVWSWQRQNEPFQLVLTGIALNSGEELTLSGAWAKKDSEGCPLPSGVYNISGTFRAKTDNAIPASFELATQPQQVQVP